MAQIKIETQMLVTVIETIDTGDMTEQQAVLQCSDMLSARERPHSRFKCVERDPDFDKAEIYPGSVFVIYQGTRVLRHSGNI